MWPESWSASLPISKQEDKYTDFPTIFNPQAEKDYIKKNIPMAEDNKKKCLFRGSGMRVC